MPEISACSQPAESLIANIQGMFVEDLSARLVQDGLLNVPLALLPQGFGYFNPSLYYCIAPFSRFFYQSLWHPSSLPVGPWSRAVSRFQYRAPLADCLSYWLIPEFPDQEVLFRYVYQERPLPQSFVDRDILDMPIRVTNRFLFYFDSVSCRYQQHSRTASLAGRRISLWHETHHSLVDAQCWVMACRQFQPGMTLDVCLNLFLKICRPIPSSSSDQAAEKKVLLL